MKRKLSIGERLIIQKALDDMAMENDFLVIDLLRKPEPIVTGEDAAEESVDAQARVEAAKEHAKRAERCRNLGYFIANNPVAVDCTVLIGDQF